jgi:hypothetical protein
MSLKNESCEMENANFKEKVSYLEICNLNFAFYPAEAGKFSQIFKALNCYQILNKGLEPLPLESFSDYRGDAGFS